MFLHRFFLIFTVLLSGCTSDSESEMSVEMSQPLPEVLVENMLGEQVVLSEVLMSDRPAVINMWATWCPPCVKEMPSLNMLAAQGEVQVIAIAFDRQKKMVNTYLAENNFPHITFLWDKNGGRLREKFGNFPLPTTFVVDVSGTVRAKEMGERQWHHPSMVKKITGR